MSDIYAMSDIHGHYKALIESLNLVDLKSNKANKLIFLGDYVNKGKNSMKVLYKLKEVYERYPGQVIVLRGNHDEYFLEWLTNEDSKQKLMRKREKFTTVNSFLREDFARKKLIKKSSKLKRLKKAKRYILEKHENIIDWLNTLPYYYETETQIFVHAGILEDAGDLWRNDTPIKYFTQKHPPETGSFHKDIISGHVGSYKVANCRSYLGKIYWDGESHYYIDGNVQKSKVIPVLKYNTALNTYSSFIKNNTRKWKEYSIN